MRRLLPLVVLAVVVGIACGGGTSAPTKLPDDLSDLLHPEFIGGRYRFARKLSLGADALADTLTFSGNAVFAPESRIGLPATYKLVSGTMDVERRLVVSEGGGQCTTTGGRVGALVPGDGSFTLGPGGRYTGSMRARVTFPGTLKCVVGPGSSTAPVTLSGEMNIALDGTFVEGVMIGEMTPYSVGGLEFTGAWDFFRLTAIP